MTAIRQRMRRPKAAKRLPVAEFRELLRDHRMWCKLAIVYQPDDGLHYELVTEGSTLVDILVEVETVPDRVPLTCRLGAIAGSSGKGIWSIPAVGDEVIVAVPDGQLDFIPSIVAQLSSGDIPNPSSQGPTTNRTVIVNGTVLIHDGSGGAAELPTMAEFKAHVHPTGTGPSGVPTDPIPGLGPITGTTVLKAK